MLALQLESTAYRVMGLFHILTAIVAFGPVMLYPGLRRNREMATIASLHMKMTFPALVVVWVLGMGLAGMSEGTYKVAQTWMSLSIAMWAVMVAASWFLIRPATTDHSEAADKKLAAGVGITHLGLVISLILMIWKPGL